MKILIVCQYYYPEQFQINEIAGELVKIGHKVTVLTGLPNYPEGEIYEGYENGQKRNEEINGVRVIRCEERARKTGPINLILNYISFSANAGKKAKKLDGNFDIVMCYQLSPVTMMKPAVVYAKKNHVPLLTYCLDIWPESAKDHLNLPIIYQFISVLSKRLYKKSDYIVVTSRPFIDYFRDVIGYPTDKMRYIPQHADSAMLNLNFKSEENGIVDFMYAGNMGKGQWLDVIIKAVAELKNRNDFLVHMVGDGSKRRELESLAENLGVADKFIFYGNQKREDMPGFYKKADALLITLRGNNAVGDTMPGKLQMYMTTGKPIFGAINGAAREVVEEAKCGICVKAGDYKGLAGVMKDYIENSERYYACGDNAKRYFKENFSIEKYMDSMEKLMEEIVHSWK